MNINLMLIPHCPSEIKFNRFRHRLVNCVCTWEQETAAIYQSHKPHNAPVTHPATHHSEQKCAHFCSEWYILGYESGALWDLCMLFIPWWRHKNEIFSALLALCGHRWIALTKASDVELWCFLWSAPWINGWVNNREAGYLRRDRAHYDVIVMHHKRFACQKNQSINN